MDIKLNKLFFILSIFSIHIVPFAQNISFETFPILLLLIIFYLFFIRGINLKYYFANNQIIILIISFLIFTYLINFWDQNNKFIELIKYLVGPIILLFFIDLKKYFSINEILIFGLGLILLYLIFFFRVPIIFGFTCNILEFFIGRLDCSHSANLTRPFLITPEPSYLSLMLGFYLIVLNYFKKNIFNKNKKKFYLAIEISICYIIFATSSRIGLLFLLIYIFYKIFSYKIYKNIYFLLSILCFSIFIIFFSNFNILKSTGSNYKDNIIESRNILNIDYIIHRFNNKLILSEINCNLIKEEDIYVSGEYIKSVGLKEKQLLLLQMNDSCYVKNNLLSIINISEPTGFVRIIHNYLSFNGSLKNNFIGLGLGSYSKIWYLHAEDFNITHLIKTNEVMQKWYPDIKNKKQYVQNYFFSILHDGGIIPAILILILILKSLKIIIKNKFTFGYVVLSYVVLTFFFQSPITSPYPWMALGLILFNNKKYA